MFNLNNYLRPFVEKWHPPPTRLCNNSSDSAMRCHTLKHCSNAKIVPSKICKRVGHIPF